MADQLRFDPKIGTTGGYEKFVQQSDGSFALQTTTASPALSLPTESTPFTTVMPAPQKTWRSGFDATLAANGVDTAFMTLLQAGSGMAVSQASGSLVITSGTTAYAESIIRSVVSWKDTFKFRYFLTLSQRIANNDTYVELVDIIGDGLAFTVNSATSVTVTIPSNPFAAANIGQSISIGALTLASCLSQKAVIASVSGNDVTFTVAGFPASGNGTCSLFGWNYHHVLYTSTTSTNAAYGTQRNGWTSGDTTATINTSASGHLGIMTNDGEKSAYFDKPGTSSTASDNSQRASSDRNVPATETPLYIQIRVVNGSTAPASTTTATIGFVEMDNYIQQQVSIVGLEPLPKAAALPVEPFQFTSSNLNAQVTGNVGHSTASSGNPVRVAGRVNTAADTTLVAGDVSDLFMSQAGQLVIKDYADATLDWQSAAAASGIVNTTTAVTLKAAGGAGIRNYLTGVDLATDALGGATELVIRDGASGTVIWRTKLQTTALPVTRINFPTPLRGTAATLMEVALLTAVTGGVYVNAQGYQAA
jgi:hypothetical protein